MHQSSKLGRRGPGGRPAAMGCALIGAVMMSPLVAVAADVTQLVATECAQCHGPDGNSVAPTFPKIAGLRADYIAKQLREFARADRPGPGLVRGATSTETTRPNDVMTPIAAKLTASQIKDLADYFSRQRRTGSSVFNPGMAALGRDIYLQGNRESGLPSCAGCHRQDGSGTERNPMIAGQNAAYVLAQLRAFRDDTRSNDRAMLMRTTAGRMTEQEMIAVSEYVAGLPAVTAPR